MVTLSLAVSILFSIDSVSRSMVVVVGALAGRDGDTVSSAKTSSPGIFDDVV